LEESNPRVAKRVDDLHRVVGRAIVDDHKFIVPIRLVEHALDTPANVVRVVVAGYADANFRHESILLSLEISSVPWQCEGLARCVARFN